MRELLSIAKKIVRGIFTIRFDDEVLSLHYRDLLVSLLVQFALFIASAIIVKNKVLAIVMVLYLLITFLFFIYHRSNKGRSIRSKAITYFVIYSVFFLPVLIFYLGAQSLVTAFVFMFLYFSTAFVLDFLSALPFFIIVFGAAIVMDKYYDFFSGFDLINAEPSLRATAIFSICAYFFVVITIGSLLRNTINYYNDEAKKSEKLLDQYQRTLFFSEERSAYNERFLITHVADLTAHVKLGSIPGFAVAAISIANFEVVESLSGPKREDTRAVFVRKINKQLEEGEVLIRQDKNRYFIIFETNDTEYIEKKLEEINTAVSLTMFAHFPKAKLYLSIGYATYDENKASIEVIKEASANMEHSVNGGVVGG